MMYTRLEPDQLRRGIPHARIAMVMGAGSYIEMIIQLFMSVNGFKEQQRSSVAVVPCQTRANLVEHCFWQRG